MMFKKTLNKYMHASHIYLNINEYGYGVYAKKRIKKNEVIEYAPVYRLINCDGNDNPHFFTWGHDKKGPIWVAATGFFPFYNHSFNPNVETLRDYETDIMTMVAIKDINKDEELCHQYRSASWRKVFRELK